VPVCCLIPSGSGADCTEVVPVYESTTCIGMWPQCCLSFCLVDQPPGTLPNQWFWNFVLRSSTLVGREWSWPHTPGLVCYPYLCREIPNSNFQVQLFVLTILSKKHGAWGTACLKKSSFYVTGTFFFHVTCLMLNFALVGYACFSCMHGF